ncbi:hypothetical protein [Nonomuraea sp. NPDC050310]|uniref:hypothetical protein n=1 Tax=unclassified Nonomuraea TaxID=2593643 RepID=UPI0033D6716E
MKSLGLARRVAALGATTAVLATMVTGLMAGSAQAATSVTAGKATQSAAAPKPKVSVSTPTAKERNYEGSCPTRVDFSAQVKLKLTGGKTVLAYRWLHGDGSASKVKTLKLSGKGTKSVTVRQSLTFNGDVKGAEVLQVLSPRKVTSKKGYFSVDCADERVAAPRANNAYARAWVNPDVYVGTCTPGDKIYFTGLIKVDDPRWVKYRWILNGRAVDGGAVKVWNTRKVGFGFSPRESHHGWAVLELLGRDAHDSNRVHYKVVCKDEAPATKVSVSGLTTAADHGSCPTGKVSAHATVSSTGAGKVTYTFAIDGKSHSGSVEFAAAGSKTVEMPAVVLSDPTKAGRMTVSVVGPHNSDSIAQDYAAPCKTNDPIALSVDLTVSQNECKTGQNPSGKAVGTVTLKGKVEKAVVVNVSLGGTTTALTFTAEGTQSIPAQDISAASGSLTLTASAGAVSASDKEDWSFTCKPTEVPKPDDTKTQDS